MSTMAVSSGGVRSSSLNPNAPLFIPAAYQQVEDFSPEWWDLVKTTGWFRDHWFRLHQDQETFDGDDDDDDVDEDVASLLPESFDLGGDFSDADAEAEAIKKDLNSEAVLRGLSLTSPRNGAARLSVEPAKYREKPVRCASPKFSPRRGGVIHQPR